MSDTETPPSYEELFPPKELASHILERHGGNPPPAWMVERFSRAAPHHATYFNIEKDWAEGGGYYRGNQSQLCHQAIISGASPGLLSLSLTHSVRRAGLEGEEGGGGQHGLAWG